MEYRNLQISEIRFIGGDAPKITGHAIVFNQRSEDLGGFIEYVEPGAFSESLHSHDIRSLWNHQTSFPLGRTKNGTLRLTEDERGLLFENDLPPTSYARDLIESMKRGDVDSMSFGFSVPKGGDSWRMENDTVIRALKKITVYEVSPVTFPAYPQTDVAVRSLAEEMRKQLTQAVDVPIETERVDEEFQKRIAEDAEFLARRTPPAHPLSYAEILKRVTRGF